MEMEERSKEEEIKFHIEELEKLGVEMRPVFKVKKFLHKCGNCGFEWMGFKEDPVECINCKRRFVAYKATGAERMVNMTKAFDKMIRQKGAILYECGDVKRLFKIKGENFEYVKTERGATIEQKDFKSSIEILKRWDGWEDFLKKMGIVSLL